MQIMDSFGQPVSPDALIIRHTEVEQFLRCRREWWFTSHNGLNLEPAFKGFKLAFGSCWHKALEYRYLGKDMHEGFNEQYAEEKDKLEQNMGDGVYEESFQEELQEHHDLGHTLIDIYPEWADDGAEPSDKEFTILSVEKRLLIPLMTTPTGFFPGIKIYIAAKLDGILDYKRMVWGFEHKSMGKSTSVEAPAALLIDLQMAMQLWCIRQILRHEGQDATVGGVIYNLARKQKPGPRVKAPIFGRHEVRRGNNELDILEDYMKTLAAEMMSCSISHTFRFYSPQIWGGYCNWGCNFRSVCIATNRGDNVDMLLKTGFKGRDRDIWKMLEAEMGGA